MLVREFSPNMNIMKTWFCSEEYYTDIWTWWRLRYYIWNIKCTEKMIMLYT